MKKWICLLGLLTYGVHYSQEINCAEKEKQLTTSIEAKDYKQANKILSELKTKCLSHSESVYLKGAEVLEYNAEVASEKTKEEEVKKLFQWYDLYDKYFPENKNANNLNKATALQKFNLGNNDEIFGYLDKAFLKNPNQFTNPSALYLYFALYTQKFKEKTNGISFDQLFQKYSDILLVIEKTKSESTNTVKITELDTAKLGINALAKEYLTVENLTSYAEKNYEKNKTNTNWLLGTANTLSEKCAAKPIFGTIAFQLQELDPSSRSAYYLGLHHLKTRKQDKAVEYFNQSANLSVTNLEKAKMHYTIAKILSSTDMAGAKKSILTAIENNPANGEYQIFLANLYYNSIDQCGTTSVTKKAIHLLANTTAQKAAQVESRLKTTVEQLTKQYPGDTSLTKEEKQQVKKANGKVVIGCWINETVQF